MQPRIAVVNNYDDPQGGPRQRIQRLKALIPGLSVIHHLTIGEQKNHEALYGRFDGFLFSGSHHDVKEKNRRGGKWVKAEAEFIRNCPKPFLGICYGLQVLTYAFGGTVRQIQGRKLDHSRLYHHVLELKRPCVLLPDKHAGFSFMVEEFHAFEANPNTLPEEFTNVARPVGRDSSVQIIQHKTRPLYGVQFHPEGFAQANREAVAVGAEMIRTFARICTNVRGSVRAGALHGFVQ